MECWSATRLRRRCCGQGAGCHPPFGDSQYTCAARGLRSPTVIRPFKVCLYQHPNLLTQELFTSYYNLRIESCRSHSLPSTPSGIIISFYPLRGCIVLPTPLIAREISNTWWIFSLETWWEKYFWTRETFHTPACSVFTCKTPLGSGQSESLRGWV